MNYRQLVLNDYEQYNKIRSHALDTVPEAFASTNEAEIDNRKERFTNLVTHQFNFITGAFDGEVLVGMVGFVKEERIKLKHKGLIWGMFVDKSKQGLGIGSKLIKIAINKAFEIDELKQINLSVVATNTSAVKLYEKTGFVFYGLEKDALSVNNQFFDEYLMVRYR